MLGPHLSPTSSSSSPGLASAAVVHHLHHLVFFHSYFWVSLLWPVPSASLNPITTPPPLHLRSTPSPPLHPFTSPQPHHLPSTPSASLKPMTSPQPHHLLSTPSLPLCLPPPPRSSTRPGCVPHPPARVPGQVAVVLESSCPPDLQTTVPARSQQKTSYFKRQRMHSRHI